MFGCRIDVISLSFLDNFLNLGGKASIPGAFQIFIW